MSRWWTDERIATAKRLWADGERSLADIAVEMGTTASAVGGKLNRLGELRTGPRARGAPVLRREAKQRQIARHKQARSRHPAGEQPATDRQVACKPVVQPAVQADDVLPAPRVASPLRRRSHDPRKLITFGELEAHHCRWPVGDPQMASFRFCGEQVLPGRPYCADCNRLAYAPKDGADGPGMAQDGQTSLLATHVTPNAVSAAGGPTEREMEAIE